MENEIVVKENKPLTAAEIRENVNLIQDVMSEVMQKDQHYGVIPGCKKPSLFKAGAEKLSLTFRLRPIMDNDKDISIIDMANGHREVRVYCHILSASGQELATGIGSCSTMESKFRYRGGEKKGTGQTLPIEYWNLKKAEKNREAQELIGGANFSAGKIDGVWQICETGEKMENPDIADVYNTVLKMAKKRAYVDGILSATCASDIFTQDIEDFVSEGTETIPPVKTKPPVAMPQATTAPIPPKAEKAAPASHEQMPALISEPPKAGIAAPASHEQMPALISEPQAKRLYAIAMGSGYTGAEIKEFLRNNFGIETSKEIQREFYDDVIRHFQVKKDVE